MGKQLPMPPQDTLKVCFDYDPATGALTWRSRPEWTFVVREDERFTKLRKSRIFNARFPGTSAVCFNKRAPKRPSHEGRVIGSVTLNSAHYLAPRVIWKLVYNEEPEQISFYNGNSSDLRLQNLRPTFEAAKAKHHTIYGHNTSGFRGVGWHSKTNRWRAYIKVSQRNIHLGLFGSLAEAVNSRIKAEARHGWKPR